MFNLIFKIKMDLTRKSRFVAGGSLMNLPQAVMYSIIGSRDNVRIIMCIMVLNVLGITLSEIGDTYLNMYINNNVYIILGK